MSEARLDGPDDPRQYVRIAVDLPTNIKMNAMSDPIVAIAATVIAICISAGSYTDGHVPINAIRRAGIDDTTIKEMIQEGVWHDEHHDCERCPKPRAGKIFVHDYLRHQRSSTTVKELSSKRAAAGAAGAERRWAKHRLLQEAAREKLAAKAVAAGDPSPVREDVQKLCDYMAGLIQKNDSQGRRPAVGKAWYEDMRKMLDLDGFSKEDLGRVIKWTQSDSFWSTNIKSPFKLRKQLRPDGNDLMAKMKAELSGRPAPGRRGATQGRIGFEGQSDVFTAQAGETLGFDDEEGTG